MIEKLELFTESDDIIAWLERHSVKNYSLIPSKKYGFVVNVNGDVNLIGKQLTHFKVKFHHVKGIFTCANNELISLYGVPDIIDKSFNCSGNALTSLKYGPVKVKYTYECSNNQLTSLRYIAREIGRDIDAGKNQLTSLKYAPKTIHGDAYFHGNAITSLKDCPEVIKGSFYVRNNKIDSLEYLPNFVGGLCSFSANPIADYFSSSSFTEVHAEHLRLKAMMQLKDTLQQNLPDNSLAPKKMKL